MTDRIVTRDMARVLDCLRDGPSTCREIAGALRLTRTHTNALLVELQTFTHTRQNRPQKLHITPKSRNSSKAAPPIDIKICRDIIIPKGVLCQGF